MKNRREFISSGAALAVATAGNCAFAMVPSEQAAWDRYKASEQGRSEGVLGSAPFLQVPAPDSMGVVFAVNELANGFAEVADNPDMKGAVCHMAEGLPQAGVDDRVLQVRITGLKPATKYWYRVGAAGFTNPVGYWKRRKTIEWSPLYSFTTPGEMATSRFAVINDTHEKWDAFKLVTDKLAELAVPVIVWNGDLMSSLARTREDIVRAVLKPCVGEGFAASLPVLLNRGNHDFRGEASIHLERVMMTRLPTERNVRDWALTRNFAYRQGDIALIGLDTGEDKPDCHPAHGGIARFEAYRTAQTAWLRDQFRRREISGAPYIVAFAHIPIFDSRPNANPGTILEDWADWQKQCADEWGPILSANGVQLVVAGHTHCFRCDPPDAKRTWAQIVGGGPHIDSIDLGRFPTVIEGRVESGMLKIVVHDVVHRKVAGTFDFAPRVAWPIDKS